MGHHHHGHAALGEVGHQRQDALDELRVEGGGGLIEEHHLRLHGQGAGNGDALLLAAGEVGRTRIGLVLEPHQVQLLQGLGPGLVRREFAELAQREGDVLHHGLVREQVELLEHHADPLAQLVRVVLQDRAAVQQDVALIRFDQAVHDPQQRGLAGAGGADDRGRGALLHVEVDAAEDMVVTERQVQVLAGQGAGGEFRHALCSLADRCRQLVRFLLLRPAGAQPVVDEVHEVRQRNGQDQVQNAGGHQRGEVPGVGHGVVTDPEDLAVRASQAQHKHQRRVLHQRDELVDQGREHAADALRHHHQAHGVAVAEAQCTGGLQLALLHALDAGAEDLADVGAAIRVSARMPSGIRVRRSGEFPGDGPEPDADHQDHQNGGKPAEHVRVDPGAANGQRILRNAHEGQDHAQQAPEDARGPARIRVLGKPTVTMVGMTAAIASQSKNVHQELIEEIHGLGRQSGEPEQPWYPATTSAGVSRSGYHSLVSLDQVPSAITASRPEFSASISGWFSLFTA